jgi:hypothetical protein
MTLVLFSLSHRERGRKTYPRKTLPSTIGGQGSCYFVCMIYTPSQSGGGGAAMNVLQRWMHSRLGGSPGTASKAC